MNLKSFLITFGFLLSLFASIVWIHPVAYAEPSKLGKELYEAALFQDMPLLQSLLAKGADANYYENGRPILGWAAQNGNVQIVEALLKGGANPNLADQGVGHTPLMRAIDTQHLDIVRALLKAKADPNAKTPDGESCLMMAVESSKPEIVSALIAGGANVKEVLPDGDSPMLRAAQDGSSESLKIVTLLAKAGAELNASNAAYTPLIYALSQGNKDLTKTLLDAGADPNKPIESGRTPLQSALDNPDLLKLLIDAKADPNRELGSGGTLLQEAIQNYQIDTVKVLLDGGADAAKPDSYGNTPLQIAEQYGKSDIAELIKSKIGSTQGSNKMAALGSSSTSCSIADAAKRQMELHGKLQALVNAGKMNSDIFRTFSEDTKDYAQMLADDPSEACRLFERLSAKYGVS